MLLKIFQEKYIQISQGKIIFYIIIEIITLLAK